MAKLYYDRYQYIRDWANSQGKTALHVASMRGNEEIVRVWVLPRRENAPREPRACESDRLNFD